MTLQNSNAIKDFTVPRKGTDNYSFENDRKVNFGKNGMKQIRIFLRKTIDSLIDKNKHFSRVLTLEVQNV